MYNLKIKRRKDFYLRSHQKYMAEKLVTEDCLTLGGGRTMEYTHCVS